MTSLTKKKKSLVTMDSASEITHILEWEQFVQGNVCCNQGVSDVSSGTSLFDKIMADCSRFLSLIHGAHFENARAKGASGRAEGVVGAQTIFGCRDHTLQNFHVTLFG